MTRPYHRWTESDTATLRKLHGSMPHAELALRMKRSPSYLYKKAAELGLGKERDELASTLLPLIEASGSAGIRIDQLADLAGFSARTASRALDPMLAAGQVHRHRAGNAYLHYTSEADCAAGLQRFRDQMTERRRAADRQRHADRLAAEGRAPRARAPRAAKRAKPQADRRPGVAQLVTLSGNPAPVRVAGPRGPAHIPGDPHIPPTARITRLQPTSDSRYTPKPGEFSEGAPKFSKRRPGTYSPELPPSNWARALAGHGA